MKMRSNLIGRVIELKLELTDRFVDKLPEHLKMEVRDFRNEVLTSLNEKITSYLEKKPEASKAGSLKKIELE